MKINAPARIGIGFGHPRGRFDLDLPDRVFASMSRVLIDCSSIQLHVFDDRTLFGDGDCRHSLFYAAHPRYQTSREGYSTLPVVGSYWSSVVVDLGSKISTQVAMSS